MPKLRTALLINQDKPSSLDLQLLALSRNSSKYSIDLILRYYPASLSLKEIFQKLVFIIVLLVESMIYKKHSFDHGNHEAGHNDFQNIPFLSISTEVDPSGDLMLSEESSSSLLDYKLDLIVCTHLLSIPSDFFQFSTHGLVKIVFGEAPIDLVNQAVGFFETAYQISTSSFQIVASGKKKLYCPKFQFLEMATSFPFSSNNARLQIKSIHFLHQFIEFSGLSEASKYKQNNLEEIDRDQLNYPSLRCSAKALFTLTEITVSKIITKFNKKYHRWGIGFAEISSLESLGLEQFNIIKNRPNHYYADPFLIKHNKLTYCFAEDYDHVTCKGAIRAFQIEGKGYIDLGLVLEEPFHISYPNVFEVDGGLYMLPETSANRTIQLYKCQDFPMVWQQHKILMKDISAADTNIFYHDGRWWMFTNIDTANIGDHQSELHIFYADQFDSEFWTPHPKNPVVTSSLQARNAGFTSSDKACYRVFQKQDFNFYGRSIGIAKINLLDLNQYEEEVVTSIKANFIENIQGTHHLHRIEDMVALDFNRFETLE